MENLHWYAPYFTWLEQTRVSVFIRESPSPYAFPFVLLLHTIGMGIVVALSAAVGLRVLGFAPAIKLAPMRKFFPILWLGFWVNAITGSLLVMQDATSKLTNYDFYVKLVFIVLAVINLQLLKKRVFGDPTFDDQRIPSNTKILAVMTMIFWIGAITAGRLLAYIGPVAGLG
jgi:hypothetical protein